MNLEDLILETQISELKRLQSGCIKARESIQRIQSLTAQLDDHATRAKAEIQSTQDTKTQRQIDRVEAEAKKIREQTANQTADQHQAARAARAEQIKALNAQLKQDIVDCQQQLQSKISELRGTEDFANSLLDTGPQEVLTNEVINDLPEFDLEESESKITNPAASAQHLEIDAQGWDLEPQGGDAIQETFESPLTELSSLPDANAELTSEESGTATTTHRVNLALTATENFNAKKPAIWGRGLPLLILGFLLFCAGTVVSAVSKIDLGSLMNFDLSEADLTWLGISCGIGMALAVVVGFMLRKLASRGVKHATQEMLLDTPNADAVAELKTNNSDPESITPIETSAPPMAPLKSVPQEIPIAPMPALKKYDHQRAAQLYAAADEQMNALVSQHAERIDQHLAQFEDQFLQYKSESGEANSSVEKWRNKELSRIQNHAAASLEQAISKLAQDVQTKHDQLSIEAAKSLSRWKANVMVASEVARISAARATQFPAWKQLCSHGWTAPSSLPATLTAGDLQLTMPVAPETMDGKLESVLNIQLPGLLNFPRDASMVIEHDANGREPALDFVRAMALRLFTSIATGQVQFTLIDPLSPEQSFSGLTPLAKYNEQLIDGQVSSDSSQIEMSLRRVGERMDRVLKAFLDSGANSLDEHNAMSADSKEPYHFVVIAGFPKDFTEDAARSLTSILNGGALCGVHVILMWSSDQALPRPFKTKTLQKNCTQFQVKNGAVQTGSSLTANEPNELVQFTAIQSPNPEEYKTVVSAVGEKLQPIALVEDAAVVTLTLLEQPSTTEPPVESSNGAAASNSPEAVTETIAEVPEESHSLERPIVASSSPIEPATIDNPVFDNSLFELSVTESEAMPQGIAAIPVAHGEVHDHSNVTTTGEEFPVVETPPPSEAAGEAVPVGDAVIDEAAVEENSDVKNDVIDQSSIPEPATPATAPAIEHCAPLNEKLAHEFVESHKDGVPVWIGESSNNAAMSHKLLRTRGQNTLIVGHNDDLADGIFASTILSLCAGRASGHAQAPKVILVHDGIKQESLRKFAAAFSDAVTPRFAIRSAAGVDAVIAELIEEMNIREKNRAAKDAPEIVLAVRNVGQFPSLRRDYENTENGSSKSTPAVPRFGDLLRQGPRVGIHVLMWADTFETALLCLSHSLLRECDTRIAFTMDSQDSTSLISSPNAANIGADTAILYSEQTGAVQQFRPFAWPSVEWLATLPQSTITVASEATERPQFEIVSTSSTVEQAEISDSDGFTLAADVVQTGPAVQPTSETSPSDVPADSSAPIATLDVPTSLSTEDSDASKVLEKATGKSKRGTASVQFKSAKGTTKPPDSIPATPAVDTELPTKAATSPPNVVASATAPQKTNQSPPEKRVSGMAVRMSSRNSDPLRPLDAPPERQVQAVSNQPGPEAEFDEMDFNSIMIE